METTGKRPRPRIGESCPYCKTGTVAMIRPGYAERPPGLWLLDGTAGLAGLLLGGWVVYTLLPADVGTEARVIVALVMAAAIGVGVAALTGLVLVKTPEVRRCTECPANWQNWTPTEALRPPVPEASPAPKHASAVSPAPVPVPVLTRSVTRAACPLCEGPMVWARAAIHRGHEILAVLIMIGGFLAAAVIYEIADRQATVRQLAHRDDPYGTELLLVVFAFVVLATSLITAFLTCILLKPKVLRCEHCRHAVSRG